MKTKLGTTDHTITLDTGAVKSIVRPDIIRSTTVDNTTTYILRTATGEVVPSLGVAKLDIWIGNGVLQHDFIVANIADECILGMDFMNENGFVLDIGQQILRYRNIEIPLSEGENEIDALQAVAIDEYDIPPLMEAIIWARLDGDTGSRRFYITEPTEKKKDKLIVGRVLVSAQYEKIIPIRVMNATTS